MDEELRAAEREASQGDRSALARLIAKRIRSGELSLQAANIASELGHHSAQLAVGIPTVDWTHESYRTRVYLDLLSWDFAKTLLILCEYVRRDSYPHLQERFPEEYLLTRALELIEVRCKRGIAETTSPSSEADRRVFRSARSRIYNINSISAIEGAYVATENTATAILRLIDVYESWQYMLQAKDKRRVCFEAAGQASLIRPWPATTANYRKQALFIADRLLLLDSNKPGQIQAR